MIRTPRAACTLALLCACALPAAQADDAVVGSGTMPSCTEAALDIALGQLYPGANFPGGLLSFQCGANPTTIPLTTRKTLTGATVVDGGGLVTLDGQDGTGPLAVVGAQSRVEIRNLTLHRGRAFASHGGAIQVGAGTDVLLADSVIRESLAEGSGGAIHVEANAGLRIERSQFIDNSALHGGAIASNSPLTVLDSSYSNNVTAANGEGGAIQIWFARLDARRTQFVDNRAAQGGALAVRGNGTDYATLIDVSFTGNTANNDGGAVLLYDNAGVTGQRVLATGNQATAGGVFSLRGSVTGVGQPRQIGAIAGLLDSRFSGNQASSMGGVAYVFGTSPGVGGSIGEFVLDHCVVVGNTAYEGGAIYSRGQLLLGATSLERNAAFLGGALSLKSTYAIGDTELLAYTQLRDLVFRQNTASIGGGAIYATSHIPIYENVQFDGNSSVQGGAIFQEGFTAPITRTSFTNNLASTTGAAIYLRDTGTIQLYNLVFSGNQAYDVGGQGGDLAIESTGNPGTLRSQVQLSHASLLDGIGDSGASLYVGDLQSDLTIRNSLVFGSSGIACGGPGAIYSAGWNFMPAECAPNQPTDVTIATRAALQLHPLSNNVGAIAALVPMAGSPVIDHANCTSGRTTDARGQTAPVDGDGDLDARCDSGAIERQTAEIPPAFVLFVDGFEN